MANLPRVMGGFSHGDGVASNGTSPVPTITVGLPSCTDQGIGPEWKSALGRKPGITVIGKASGTYTWKARMGHHYGVVRDEEVALVEVVELHLEVDGTVLAIAKELLLEAAPNEASHCGRKMSAREYLPSVAKRRPH
ncbi:hypothetical protein [Oryza sativa Japonica Group]|uniref:Uncharacterized protein n=1 Tax=Oryza sativa subsp. japonica TaxID=39947 RepID=Q5QMU0_ORYSJ|nr:hypothetical protein [Oryza sativa Japonica Group]BAD73268.1 hypothetical protein [Oryza sativa Japonica Group]